MYYLPSRINFFLPLLRISSSLAPSFPPVWHKSVTLYINPLFACAQHGISRAWGRVLGILGCSHSPPTHAFVHSLAAKAIHDICTDRLPAQAIVHDICTDSLPAQAIALHVAIRCC